MWFNFGLDFVMQFVLTGLFWWVIWLCYRDRFQNIPDRWNLPPDQLAAARKQEMANLDYDLKVGQRLNRVDRWDNGVFVKVMQGEPVYNIGIAESVSNKNFENENIHPGDSWLADNRPWWFAVFQIVGGLLLLSVFYLGVFNLNYVLSYRKSLGTFTTLPLIPGLITFPIVTGVTFLYGMGTVPPLFRVAVKRWNKQRSMLGEGLQWTVPLGIIESRLMVDIRRVVWEPHKAPAPGIVPDPQYPDTIVDPQITPIAGKILLEFLGKWEIALLVSVTWGTRLDSPEAWRIIRYKYSTRDAVVLQVIGVMMGVLTTKVRELQEVADKMKEKLEAKAHAGDKEYLLTTHELELVAGFLNRIPEVCADVLQTLVGGSPNSTEGLSFEGFKILQVLPGKSFSDLVKQVTEKKVGGEADARRWDNWQRGLAHAGPEFRSDIMKLQTLAAQVEVANKPSGVDAIVSAYAAQLTSKAVQPAP